jgi:hypothetical protein
MRPDQIQAITPTRTPASAALWNTRIAMNFPLEQRLNHPTPCEAESSQLSYSSFLETGLKLDPMATDISNH